MLTCEQCGGFLPGATNACPNCDVAIDRVRFAARTAIAILGAGAAAITLMACYGPPPTGDGNTTATGAVNNVAFGPQLSTFVLEETASAEASASPDGPVSFSFGISDAPFDLCYNLDASIPSARTLVFQVSNATPNAGSTIPIVPGGVFPLVDGGADAGSDGGAGAASASAVMQNFDASCKETMNLSATGGTLTFSTIVDTPENSAVTMAKGTYDVVFNGGEIKGEFYWQGSPCLPASWPGLCR